MNRKYKAIIILFFVLIQLFGFLTTIEAAEDKPLVIVLDPGHGGTDAGAVNKAQSLYEREIVMKIARYIKSDLEQYSNVKVYLTHNGLNSNEELSLRDRGTIAANYKADMVISLHINASGGTGAEIFVTRDTGEKRYNEDSTKLGNLFLKHLGYLGIGNRGVKTRKGNTITSEPKEYYYGDMEVDYYGIIRYPRLLGIPSVLVEHCFIDSADIQFLNSEEKIKRLATADVNAIVEHFKLVKEDPTKVKTVSLNKANTNIYVGNKETLVVTITPNTAVNKKVTWTTSDVSVASVSNGVVTGIKEGVATITAKTEDGDKTAKTVVSVKPYIQVDKKEIYLLEGNKSKLTITVPEEAVGKETYSSSDNTIISVDNKGVITALKEGTAEVIINANAREVRKTVIVTQQTAGQEIKVNNLKEENDLLTRIKDGTTVQNFKTNFVLSADLELVIKDYKGTELKDTDIISTECSIFVREKTSKKILQSYETIIYGDINRDGKITSMDYVMIKDHIMKDEILSQKLINVADVSREGKVTSLDYVAIKDYIMEGIALKTI